MTECTPQPSAVASSAIPRLGWLTYLLIGAVLLLTAYVEIGFFYPDPLLYTPYHGWGLMALLWGLRIAVPTLGVGCCALLIAMRLGKLPRYVPALVAFGLIGGGVAAYLGGSFFYYELSPRRVASAFHPYLQFAPKLPQRGIQVVETSHSPSSGDLVPISTTNAPRSSSRHSLVFIGGSSTEWGDSQGRGWPALTEALLHSKGLSSVSVLNAGRQNYTSLHAVINYAVNISPTRPDTVVVMHAINDLMQNADQSHLSTGPFRDDYGHFLGPVRDVVRPKSFLGTLTEKLSAAWYHKPRRVISDLTFPGLAVFKRNLRTLVALARQDGAHVILMSEPHLYKEEMTEEEIRSLYMIRSTAGPESQWSVERLRVGMQTYNNAIREVADELDTGFIDLAASVPQTLEYFTDEVHYRDRTFPLIAEVVSEELYPTLAARVHRRDG